MMGIPMAVTSLGMGIDGVKDIGGGGGGSDLGGGGDFSQQQPDPQYPNTSGRQKLDEVVVVAKKKEMTNKGVDGGLHEWGIGYQDRGEKDGTVQGSVDINDFPIYSNRKTFSNLFLKLIDKLFGTATRADKIAKKLKSNESTMENRNEEPVEPPKNGIEYTVEGQLKPNSRYGVNSPNYGGTGESSSTKDYNKAKRDSLRFSETNFFKKLSIRRDTIK